MRPFRTFQRKLLFFFIGLYVVVQAFAFLAVNAASRSSARDRINDELAAGGRMFDWVIRSRSERFLQAAQVMADDFGLKTAVGSGNKRTMLAAMKNHGARVHADHVLLLSLDRRIIADTQHPNARPASFPFPRLLRTAERAGRASALAFFEGGLYRFVAVPLRAPLPAAWIVAGFRIDDALAAELKRITQLDVTFVVEQGNDRSLVAAASSLDSALRRALEESLRSSARKPGGYADLILQGEQYLSLSRDLGAKGDPQVTVFLQRSLDTALQPFFSLRNKLGLLFSGGLLIMLAGGIVIAARVTRPIRRLAESAHSIEQGNYTCPLPVDAGQDEVGRLSKAFNLMQEAIKQREEKIRYTAYYDILTGLANRSCLYQRLSAAIADASRQHSTLALIIMNIDRFNQVVATLGQAAGKTILQKMVPLLQKAAPAPVLAARIGGDVFALMLPGGADVQDAVRIVRDIQKRLEKPFWVDNVPIQVEARFGISAYPAHGADADMLLRLGDVAVHLAKGAPSGYVVYSSELDHHSSRHLVLMAELRHAIDHHDLLLYYQPKIDFRTCRVIGVEALIRWKHAQHGFISPDEFIRLSEGTGLIKPVTDWTLKTAISQCAELSWHGINVNVGINLSARVLPDHQLPDMISSLFGDHRVHPGQITLEVTESAIMADSARTLDVITRLDSIGAGLCVDDFGTGYSSLSYLQRLPVDEVKIDKSFVQMMDRNENDRIIVDSIIELGHNLGLKVTAEGVENFQVWEMLKARGCDVAQGFLHGRPMPLDEFIAWSERSPWGLGRVPQGKISIRDRG